MESKFIINSIGLGGAFFVGLILFWFIFMYLKKRLTSDQTHQGHFTEANFSRKEKRRHPRIEISWPGLLENSERSQEIVLKDISLGGAFVICQKPLALQDKFKITINLSDRVPLQLNAEVVWSNVNMPRNRVVNRGMGIRFIRNELKARQQLQGAITAAVEKTSGKQ